MKRFLIVLLFLFLVENSYPQDINTSDIRVEIKSQIKVLKEKREEVLKRISKAKGEEKKELKAFLKEIDEKIKRLKKLIDRYNRFNSLSG